MSLATARTVRVGRREPPESLPFDDVPPDEALKRAPVVFERSKEVLVARGGSGGAVICCTGGLHQLGLHLRVFALAGLAGVRLHPVGHYQGHNTIARLAATGRLRKVLGKILAPA